VTSGPPSLPLFALLSAFAPSFVRSLLCSFVRFLSLSLHSIVVVVGFASTTQRRRRRRNDATTQRNERSNYALCIGRRSRTCGKAVKTRPRTESHSVRWNKCVWLVASSFSTSNSQHGMMQPSTNKASRTTQVDRTLRNNVAVVTPPQVLATMDGAHNVKGAPHIHMVTVKVDRLEQHQKRRWKYPLANPRQMYLIATFFATSSLYISFLHYFWTSNLFTDFFLAIMNRIKLDYDKIAGARPLKKRDNEASYEIVRQHCRIALSADAPTIWNIVVKAPDGSDYAGGVFQVSACGNCSVVWRTVLCPRPSPRVLSDDVLCRTRSRL